MQNRDFKRRLAHLRARTQGRWPEILMACGVPATVLNRRNQPCPSCHGRDRFQFTDRFQTGNYFCRGCGPGDGFNLLKLCCGLDFTQALERIEQCVGGSDRPTPAQPEPTSERMRALAKRIWEEASRVTPGDPVDGYLRQRGIDLDRFPSCLRFHPALGYYVKSDPNAKAQKIAEYPAMLACVYAPNGHPVTLHRTYLTDGRKAEVDDAKKLLCGDINGAAVRLFEVAEVIAIAEGIETALAVHLAWGFPVWSALSAGNLERVWIPRHVREVHVFADNDAEGNYDGQASGFSLARRLKKEASALVREVVVHVPGSNGDDWADVWRRRQRRPHRRG